MEKRNSLSLLVKPTNMCNFRCTYCFNDSFNLSKQQGYNSKMSLKTVEKICDFQSKSQNSINWVWHGGEPLLMGEEFYIDQMEILQSYNIDNNIGMQSNGSLLTDKFYKLLQKYNIHYSISHDGIKNDETRGHTKEIEKQIKIIHQNNNTVSAISVVTPNNFNNLIDSYYYFRDLKMNGWAINRIFFNQKGTKLFYDELKEQYLDKYAELFKIYLSDPDPLQIRQFDEIISLLFHEETRGHLCSLNGNCSFSWLGINPDGSIYPCDRWLPEEYKMGNIYDFEDYNDLIKNSPNYWQNFDFQYEHKKYCRTITKCWAYDYCHGGCNQNFIHSYLKTGSYEDEEQCQYIRGEIQTIYNILKFQEISDVKNPTIRLKLQDLNFINLKNIYNILNDYTKYKEGIL